jgi:hypothetical protein
MKTFLLFLFVVSAVFGLANDTLTRAEVYNFSVGDTFDYKHSNSYFIGSPGYQYSESFERHVIVGTYFSVDSTTLFIAKKIIDGFLVVTYDTVVITGLQDYGIYYVNELYCLDTTYNMDSTSQYNGRRVNVSVCSGGLESVYEENRVVEGLGIARKHQSYGNPMDGFFSYTTELLYYSKGNETWGTPILNGGHLIHYTPLPEECAVWSTNIYADFPPGTQNILGITEQISSGNRIAFHGHTYVEMIYRSYNYLQNYYTPDSLIGYYRNDTINKKALFYHTLSDTAFFEYDFNYLCPAPNCISQVLVGGQLRTRWPHYIEGVGGIQGLVRVQKISFQLPGGPYVTLYGTLSSFCVCGQSLYPNDSTTCPVVSTISKYEIENPQFELFPTPVTSFVNITSTVPIEEINIYNTTGQLVLHQTSTNSTTINTEQLADGIYFYELRSNKETLKTGKLIKQ